MFFQLLRIGLEAAQVGWIPMILPIRLGTGSTCDNAPKKAGQHKIHPDNYLCPVAAKRATVMGPIGRVDQFALFVKENHT